MKITMPRYAPVVAIAATCLLLGSTGGAVAGSLITGKQIKDNTVSTKDIKNKTIAAKDLAPATVKSLKGKAGAAGADGADGDPGLNAWDVIPTGETMTGYFYDSEVSGADLVGVVENINLPAKAPSAPTQYGFGADSFAQSPEDASCTGNFDAPTAPPGQVCVYLDGLAGVTSANVYPWDAASAATDVFYLSFNETATDTPYYYYGVWAYTAP